MFSRSLCATAILLSAALRATAAGYDVTIDTSALIGNPSAPFSLDFQLNDGAGTGSAQNFASITGFNFGSGNATGSASIFGGTAGDLVSGITFHTTSAFNELYQGFTPGNTLSFHVSLSETAPSTETPDSFSFAILDQSLSNIATTGIADTLLEVDLTDAGAIATLGNSIDGVSITATAVPEPYAAPVVAVGLLGAFACVRRMKAARRA